MAFVFLCLFIALLAYLLYEEKIGCLLCLLTLFPEIVGIILNHTGISGFNMIGKYALFILVIWEGRKIIDVNYQNIWRHPLSIMFYILIGTMILHNEYIVGGANNSPTIAAFQLNIILRILIPYVILMSVADHEDIIGEYCRSIPWWGLYFMIIFIFLIGLSSVDFSDRTTLQDETGINSIVLSRFAAITLLSSLICYLGEGEQLKKYIYFGILVLSTFMLLLASQRGTIIGVAGATIVVFSVILIRQGKVKQLLWISSGIICMTAVLLFFFNFEILHRFDDLKDFRDMPRFVDYGISWRAFSENNYLSGLGSMGYQIYTHGIRPYPHSMILELMVEYGILGLLYAISIIVSGCIMGYRILINTDEVTPEMTIPIIWFALLASVLVSGSFLSNALFFLLTGVLILTYQTMINIEKYEKIE